MAGGAAPFTVPMRPVCTGDSRRRKAPPNPGFLVEEGAIFKVVDGLEKGSLDAHQILDKDGRSRR